MSKIPVYFMPGLAANPSIFEHIQLPEDQFEVHLLEWFLPEPKESLQSYAKRMAEKITEAQPVLVGVSFGGILVQEIAKIIPVRRTIIISSVKTKIEFPKRIKLAKTTRAYKLVPTSLFGNIEVLAKYAFGETAKGRIKLYEKFLSMRDKRYLDWALEQVVTWSRTECDTTVIHIHGDADEVFPIKNIQDAIVIKGGTHVMILNKFRWLNSNLPSLIVEGNVKK
ncbi:MULTISPECIES: alpha/beta hydrolase [Flavobacterium]|uniref:alpha/beta fold hydrolase n=1 Tax=Flavobacterium TaxID=237 RepID=UPI00086EBB4D|nr:MULTISPECIES: alpha/beta hydrolase [Flavobacterium]MBN9283131.1 alpha/beta hydrolase [Flavobacterium sp.]ODS86655.1 MAG: alpha/beta hydrolase [Chryseobacterium sp. SCN 40-13]OJV67869.1 MAG: alpha/beta hydrolase [Flavobacterium sp. 40-81]